MRVGDDRGVSLMEILMVVVAVAVMGMFELGELLEHGRFFQLLT